MYARCAQVVPESALSVGPDGSESTSAGRRQRRKANLHTRDGGIVKISNLYTDTQSEKKKEKEKLRTLKRFILNDLMSGVYQECTPGYD